jgi:hypothetical protein
MQALQLDVLLKFSGDPTSPKVEYPVLDFFPVNIGVYTTPWPPYNRAISVGE